MELLCLDLEGVLIPEIWINFAERTGIDELRATTRDIPDYDELMKMRLGILDQHGYGLPDIQKVIDTLDPLDGAVELHFSPTPEPRLPSPAPTPAVPTLDSTDDPVTRWDSYEHLGGGSDGEDDDAPSGECFLHPPRPRHGEMCNVRCLTSSCARLGKHLFRKGKLIHCQAH